VAADARSPQGHPHAATIAFCLTAAQLSGNEMTGLVAVTGATGFVGSHLIRELLRRGVSVRAIARASSATTSLEAAGVDVRTAGLQDATALREAIAGAQAVIHLAALTHARTESELVAVNGGGTGAVAAASAVAGVERFVYLSSLAAVGPSRAPVQPDAPPHPLTAYGRSKLAGEVELRQSAGSMDAVTLRAPAVYGPGDRELLRFFRLARFGVLPIPAGGERPLQLVHVEDLARGIADAALAEADVAGTYYIADPQSYSWREVCVLVGQAVGRPPIFLPVPGAAIGAAAAVSESFAHAFGRSTMFNREKVRELLAPGWLCETEGARTALGFTAQIPLDEGLRATAAWYRDQGWL
jgi:nucleoside-diphosphate-sugar epimerase